MTAAVLLCAGAGRRYAGSTHKLLAPFKSRRVIDWSLQAMLAAGFEKNYLVAGALDLADMGGDAVEVLANCNWQGGLASSLRVAVKRAASEGLGAIVVGLGDQPLVPASAWRTVGAAKGAIVVASFGDVCRPPVKIEKSVWDLLPSTGDIGAQKLMLRRPELVSEVPCLGNPIDIDTEEDLQRWS